MWQICSNIALPIITFNLQFLAEFIYSRSRVPANTLPIQKASFSERQTFSEMTERVLMETRHSDTFVSFATQPDCYCVPLSVPGCLLRHSLHAAGSAECCSHCASCPHRSVATHKTFRCRWSAPLKSPGCLPDSSWLSRMQVMPKLSQGSERAAGSKGGCGLSPPLPSSYTVKMCSGCGGLLAFPRAPLHPGMAWALASPGLYTCTTLADPFGRWSGLVCRCQVCSATRDQPSLPSPQSPANCCPVCNCNITQAHKKTV